MTASRQTALGIEQNGRRVLEATQQRDGTSLRTVVTVCFCMVLDEDVDHACRLITASLVLLGIGAPSRETV